MRGGWERRGGWEGRACQRGEGEHALCDMRKRCSEVTESVSHVSEWVIRSASILGA